MTLRRRAGAAAVSAAALAFSVAAVADDGWLGLSLKIDAGGSFWSPVVQSATVSAVAPDSPAAKQNIVIGDALVEIDGLPVAGGDGTLLKTHMRKAVGEKTHLKLRRADGTVYESDVISGPRPP